MYSLDLDGLRVKPQSSELLLGAEAKQSDGANTVCGYPIVRPSLQCCCKIDLNHVVTVSECRSCTSPPRLFSRFGPDGWTAMRSDLWGIRPQPERGALRLSRRQQKLTIL